MCADYPPPPPPHHRQGRDSVAIQYDGCIPVRMHVRRGGALCEAKWLRHESHATAAKRNLYEWFTVEGGPRLRRKLAQELCRIRAP